MDSEYSESPEVLGVVLFVGSLFHLLSGVLFDIASFQGRINGPLDGAFGLTVSAILFAGVSGMAGVYMATVKETRTRIQRVAILIYNSLAGFFVFAVVVWELLAKLGSRHSCTVINGCVEIVGFLVSLPMLLIITFAVTLFGAVACRSVRCFWWFASAAFLFLVSGAISCWVLGSILMAI